ncbi:hypothetical protein [Streptomyces sp. NPDC004296]|uniref:hypothetical protein n=1 Tax=Streptomyces sp. NPDC004296 TaxID=3364697 RepID=UPI0036BC4C47
MTTAIPHGAPAPLPLVDPAPDDLVLPASRIRPGTDLSELPRFGDMTWTYSHLDASETEYGKSVKWGKFPAVTRDSLRRIAWAMFNLPTPEALLTSARRGVLSVSSYNHVFKAWLVFAHWMDKRDFTSLTDISREDLEEFAQELRQAGRTWQYDYRVLNSVSRLWAYAPHLLPQDRLVMPPWEEPSTEATDFLGQNNDTPSGENNTQVIHPAVMSPLLVWAVRMVIDLAPDIIAANRERQRLLDRIPAKAIRGGSAAAIGYLRRLIAGGKPVPRYVGNRADRLDRLYPERFSLKSRRNFLHKKLIAGTLSLTIPQIDVAARELHDELRDQHFGDGAPLDVPVTGRINGRAWTHAVDFEDVLPLRLLLATASMVVIGYLSGMRPKEFLHLQRGCCSREERKDGTVRYKITGRHFKGVRDENGHIIPEGEVRSEPWVVIEVVQRAVAVLEELHDLPMLFPRDVGILGRRSEHSGAAIPAGPANKNIAQFITWANQMARAHGREHELIPEDPEGAVTLQRFRRTIAWYIYRQPGGRIALGVQYGHVATAMGESYAGRSKADMLEILDFEQGLAMADALATAADRVSDGEGVSGPAAGRYISAASEFSNRFAGTFMGKRQISALRQNPKLQVFDNPRTFMSCNYDAFKALCDPDRGQGPSPQQTPNQSRCNPACANISRTDSQIDEALKEVAALDEEIASGINPQPITLRLKQRKTTLVEIIDRHETDRVVPAQTSKDSQ